GRADEAEPGAERTPAGRAGGGIAAADRADRAERGAYAGQVQQREEREQPLLVDGEGGVEVVRVLAVHDDADVDELLPVHPRHTPEHDVLEAHRAAPSAAHAAPAVGSQ